MNILIDSIADSYMDDWMNSLLDRLTIEKCVAIFSNQEIMENGKIAKRYATKKYYVKDVAFAKSEMLSQEPLIEPIDTVLLKRMEPYVDEIFWMMERCESRDYNHRWHVYCKHLQIWNHILDRMHINFFISFSPPHEVYCFIVYALCKIKKIPVLLLSATHFWGYFYIFTDIYNQLPQLDLWMEEIKKRYEDTSVENISLRNGLETVFDSYYDKDDITPYYMLRVMSYKEKQRNLLNRIRRRWALIKGRLRFIGWGIRHAFDFSAQIFDNMNAIAYRTDLFREPEIWMHYYKTHASPPDYTQKYIYVPLHMQPENSSSPLGGKYVDQLLMVKLLAYHLPDGYFLYVKDHPAQVEQSQIYTFSSHRSIQFYRELVKIQNVRLIYYTEDTYDLIKNSCAVATLTGTAGLEAIVYNKLYFMFGYYYTQYAPNVITIRSEADCIIAMEKMLQYNQSPQITKRGIKLYFKALEGFLHPGLPYIEPQDYKMVSNQEIEVWKQNLVNACYDKILELTE